MIKRDIGSYAGIIWQALRDRGTLTLRQIGELTGFREGIIHLALGWLARENKIRIFDKGNNSISVELNYSIPEIYY